MQLSAAQRNVKNSRLARGDSEIVLDDGVSTTSSSQCSCGNPRLTDTRDSASPKRGPSPKAAPHQLVNDVIIVDDSSCDRETTRHRSLQGLDLSTDSLHSGTEQVDTGPHIALSSVIYTTTTTSSHSHTFPGDLIEDSVPAPKQDNLNHLVSPHRKIEAPGPRIHLTVNNKAKEAAISDEKTRSGSFGSRLTVRQSGLSAIKEKSQSLDIIFN